VYPANAAIDAPFTDGSADQQPRTTTVSIGDDYGVNLIGKVQ
jgi:hypothetical protein